MMAVPTENQVSAGGVAFRAGEMVEIALIRTAAEGRWQLPKGMIDRGESAEEAAIREVREEAGVVCELIAPLETIEYWYYGAYEGTRKRYHKRVHFFLMRYIGGDVSDHDHEVAQAAWVSITKALEMLAFKSEKQVVTKAAARIGLINA